MKSPIFRRQGHDENERTSVYVLECGGRIKIGIAASVAARVDGLQLACPLPIAVVLERPFATRKQARMVERALHKAFGERRLHGEWFEVSATDAAASLREAPEMAAPVNISGRLRRAPLPKTQPSAPTTYHRDSGSATWDEMEAMTDDEWVEYMRPVAAVLQF